MAPPDQGSGAGATPPALNTQTPCTGALDDPTQHERKLSAASTSFSSPTASPELSSASSSTTTYLPASSSSKLSCESIPYAGPDLATLSSFPSNSSYESFFHIEAPADPDLGAGSEFLDFEEPPTTRPPAVQTMQQDAGAAAYDPKRLPSSMFRTRSTKPAEWSATSNESLFSIQFNNNDSVDLTGLYADFYYDDAAGLRRFPSGREAAALKLPSRSESSARSGGLCVKHDCARCGSSKTTRKSVRFAATESVSGEGKHSHSVVVSTLEVAVEETEAPAAATTKAPGPAAGWCELGCCMGLPSSSPTGCWPRCCGCHGCGCQCKWWFTGFDLAGRDDCAPDVQ